MAAWTYAPPGGFIGWGDLWVDPIVVSEDGRGGAELAGETVAGPSVAVTQEITLKWDLQQQVTNIFTFRWVIKGTLDLPNTDQLMPYLLVKSKSTWLDVNTLHKMNGQPTLLPDVLAVNNSLRNLLRCPLGERGRMRRPDYGTYLWHMLQEPMDDTSASQIRATLIQSIEKWEPRIRIIYPDTHVSPDYATATYFIRISYIYILNNTPEAITFSVRQTQG